MRSLIILGAAASVLALGACNRDAETAPAASDAIVSAEATAADTAAMDASSSAASGSTGSASRAANRDMTAGADGEAMDPAGSSTATPTGTAIAPVTQGTRDNAQMAAEETNLHPKPSGQ